MRSSLCLGLVAAALFSACPPQGVVCKPGTVPCGTGCIDPRSDRRNCGACGTACGAQMDCQAAENPDGGASCVCRPGTTLCNGVCIVTEADTRNCGGCGVACGAGQVCEQGSCENDCSAGFTRCGSSCVALLGDVGHCGGCGVACEQGQRCEAGRCTYPALAACYWSGQVVGFDPTTGVSGPLADVGSAPGALARLGEVVLSGDGIDQRLYSAVPGSSGLLTQTNEALVTGAVPNHVVVDGQYVYVVNAGAGTVLVVREGADAGRLLLDAGVPSTRPLGVVAEVQLGTNTFPQVAAKVGTTLYVPLYGGTSAETADAGQTIVKLDVRTPSAPVELGRVSLKGLDLHAFDGGSPVPRPFAIAVKGGQVYVALNNLNAATYVPEGPGLLAKLDPGTDALTVIDLGAGCLNPTWVTPDGDGLLVSCAGFTTFGSTMSVGSGVLRVDAADVPGPVWVPPAGSGTGGAMQPWVPGRLSVSGPVALVADQSLGRVAVLSLDAGLTLSRPPLELCPVSPASGFANVADVIF